MKLILFLFLMIFSLNVFGQEDYAEGDYTEEELKDYVLSDSDTLNKTILYLKKRYLDPDKIDSQKMFARALNYIERTIPKVIINHSDDLTEVTVNIENKSKTFKFPKCETVWQLSLNLRDVFLFFEKEIKTKKEQKNIELSAVEGILSTLDPHTSLLRPSLYTEMQMNNSGSFGGLGIIISMRDGELSVVSPIEDSPAYYAGIKSKDVISQIDDESTVGMELSQAVDRMRGEPGSKITIHIMRKGWKKSKPFTLTRAIIKVKSVSSNLLEKGIGYIKIKGFQGNTADDLIQHLADLKKKNESELRGLILDLRNDPGGLLDQAIKVSDVFLKNGYIVSTVGLGNSYREDKEAYDEGDEPNYPVIVLTNSGSASASEIVAGAIKVNKKGLLIGQRTFGKGSVQTLFEFEDRSALKITIAQYLIGYNISIQNVGIVPDIILSPVVLSKDEISYFDSVMGYYESDYETHLDESAIMEKLDDKSLFSLRYLYEDNRTEQQKKDDDYYRDELKFKGDYEIEFAKKLLLKAKSTTTEAMFKEVEEELKSIQSEQDKIIADKLKSFKVDWTKGEVINNPNIEVVFESTPVKAGDKLNITAKVTNKGDKTIHRLRATTDGDSYFLRGTEFLFGKIESGKTVFWNATIPIPKTAETQIANLIFKFYVDEEDLKIEKTTLVTISEISKPEYEMTYTIEDANKNGKIDVNEKIKLLMTFKNIGKANGGETSFSLKNKTNKSLYISNGRQIAKTFAVNQVFKANYEFSIKDKIQKDKLDMDIIIYDSEAKIYKKFDVSIPLNAKFEKQTKKEADITLDKYPLLVKKGEKQSVELSGEINGEIIDYYFYKSSFKKLNFEYDKFYYKSNSENLKSNKFAVEIPLKSGVNRITVIARTSETLVATKDIIIFNEN